MANAEEHRPLKSQSAEAKKLSSEESVGANGKLPAPTVDELCSDPEVCRRVGDLISAMSRRLPGVWF
jgi:hypothetical protein